MSVLNSNQLGMAYYHGAGGAIEGGVVEARSPRVYRNLRATPLNDRLSAPAAYATEGAKTASEIAGSRAKDEGRLFGSVYEVTPRTTYGKDESSGRVYGVPSPTGALGHIADPAGLDVVKHVGFSKHDGKPL
jgi:hypothetical protein